MQAEQIKHLINERKMNYFQIMVIFICILISLVDGYDVMTIAFVVPSIAELWALSPEQIGILFSAGLFGMVGGALVITPFADKFGRRKIILVCLLILTIGMCVSAFSTNIGELIVSRFFSGLAIGAIMPSINTVIAEYASSRSRSLAIGIMAASYTAGSVIGGIIYIYLINHLGWQYVFFLGSTFSTLLIPLVLCLLPESLDFILLKNNAKSLLRLNYLLKKLDLDTCERFPEMAIKQMVTKKKLNLLFTPLIFHTTILMVTSASTMMISFYFLINWTPKILVYLGYAKDLSVTGSLVMNIFGIIGGLSIGWLSKKYSIQKVTSLMAVIGFIFVMGFGLSVSNWPVIFSLIAVIGYSTFGAMAGLYAIVPTIFPPQVRVTGTGVVFGFGRLIGTFGPYLAGLLIAAKIPYSYCIFILAIPLLVSALCIMYVNSYQEKLT